MKYTVLWTGTAQQDLADLWVKSNNRKALTAAAAKSDKLLAKDPELRGDLCFDTVRSITIPPLGIDFEIVEDDRIVYVLGAWSSVT